ncbi:hypothetical protein ACJX0J_011915, partial [Zea mays]
MSLLMFLSIFLTLTSIYSWGTRILPVVLIHVTQHITQGIFLNVTEDVLDPFPMPFGGPKQNLRLYHILPDCFNPYNDFLSLTLGKLSQHPL